MNRKVKDLVNRGLIKESLYPYVVPKTLQPNKGGEWPMCTNSHVINEITIKYIFPSLWMDDLMEFLSQSKYFPKVNLKSGNHHNHIKEYDV